MKKYHYKQLRQLRKTLCYTLLRACFQGWQHYLDEQHPQRQLIHQANVTDLPGWLGLHAHSVALTMNNLRKVSAEVQNAIRQEDQYYNGLADKAIQCRRSDWNLEKASSHPTKKTRQELSHGS